jgi:hypothetical protein
MLLASIVLDVPRQPQHHIVGTRASSRSGARAAREHRRFGSCSTKAARASSGCRPSSIGPRLDATRQNKVDCPGPYASCSPASSNVAARSPFSTLNRWHLHVIRSGRSPRQKSCERVAGSYQFRRQYPAQDHCDREPRTHHDSTPLSAPLDYHRDLRLIEAYGEISGRVTVL